VHFFTRRFEGRIASGETQTTIAHFTAPAALTGEKREEQQPGQFL
jgi:hypothetical protein